jgi:hypothetical protein
VDVELKVSVVMKIGVVATIVVLRSTGTINGVVAQATIVMPENPTRSPYAQYGDTGFVLYIH